MCSVLSPLLFSFLISLYFQDKQSQCQRNLTQLGWVFWGCTIQIPSVSPAVVGAQTGRDTEVKNGGGGGCGGVMFGGGRREQASDQMKP